MYGPNMNQGVKQPDSNMPQSNVDVNTQNKILKQITII